MNIIDEVDRNLNLNLSFELSRKLSSHTEEQGGDPQPEAQAEVRAPLPSQRATMAQTYPSSSEDETCGWIAPGEYLRSLFDMPEDFVRETREEDTAEMREEEESGLADSRGEL